MTRRKILAVSVIILICFFVISVGLFHRQILYWIVVRSLEVDLQQFDTQDQPWLECAIPIPDTSFRATFLQRSIHPFLAEYDYAIRFQAPGSQETKCALPTNTGGSTEMNVYWYPPSAERKPFIRLQDKDGEYIVDLKGGRTRRLLRLRGSTYAGDLIGDVNSYGTSESAGELTVHIGDQTAEIVSESYSTEQGMYIGRIDGRDTPLQFIDANTEPEKTISIRRTLE